MQATCIITRQKNSTILHMHVSNQKGPQDLEVCCLLFTCPEYVDRKLLFFYMNLVFVLLVKSFERYWWFGSIPCRLFCYQVWCAYDVSICFLHHDNVSFIYTERDTDTYVEVYRFVLLPSSRDLNQTEKTWGKELMSLYKVKSGNLDWEVIGGLQPFFAY